MLVGRNSLEASASIPSAGEVQLTKDPVASAPATTAQEPAIPTSPDCFSDEEETSDEESTDEASADKSSSQELIDRAWEAIMHQGRTLDQPRHDVKSAIVPEAPGRGRPIQGVPRRFTFSDNDIRISEARDKAKQARGLASPISIKTMLVNPGAARAINIAYEKERERREYEREAAARAALLRAAASIAQPQQQTPAVSTVASFFSSIIPSITSFVTAAGVKETEREAARAASSASMPIPVSSQIQQQTFTERASRYRLSQGPSSSVQPAYAPPRKIIQIIVPTSSGPIVTNLPHAFKLMGGYDRPEIAQQIRQIRVNLPTSQSGYVNTNLYEALKYMDRHKYNSEIKQKLFIDWGVMPSLLPKATAKPILVIPPPASIASSVSAPVALPTAPSGEAARVAAQAINPFSLASATLSHQAAGEHEVKLATASAPDALPVASIGEVTQPPQTAQPINPSKSASATTTTTKKLVASFHQDAQAATQPPAKESGEKQQLTGNGRKKARRKQKKREEQGSSASAALQNGAGLKPKLSANGHFGNKKRQVRIKANASSDYAPLRTPTPLG